MNFYFLASFIGVGAVIYLNSKKSQKKNVKEAKTFWEKEALANSSRKKPLDNLDYIEIPLDSLPFNILADDERIVEYHSTLFALHDQKIVNLTGITNTNLKLEYGAANLNVLSAYDQNYTSLVLTLQKWADILYQNGYIAEARTILEFAISTKTDIGRTYSLLAQIYKDRGNSYKISELISTAESLHSLRSASIVRTLQEFGPYND